MAPGADTPHLPSQAPIDAYGDGGFRFAGMSHRGSLLCLPDGVWVWPVANVGALDDAALAPILACAGRLDIVILGGGRDPFVLPARLRAPFQERRLSVDAMATGPAVRTYNILLAEGRRIAAGLIAVD